mmetsp:Transcript_3463/g.5889  ORF Transcript_3463/g.5889 Transcript_3463/m.5889 type:complete len:172 (+) Transcript_3463:1264-1779(+)
MLTSKDELLDIMGVYQHHDAISGTATQHTADNYHEHLLKALQTNFQTYSQSLIKQYHDLMGMQGQPSKVVRVPRDSEDSLSILKSTSDSDGGEEQVVMFIHNPSAQNFTQLVNLPLPRGFSPHSAQIFDFELNEFVSGREVIEVLNKTNLFNNGTLTVYQELVFPYFLRPG